MARRALPILLCFAAACAAPSTAPAPTPSPRPKTIAFADVPAAIARAEQSAYRVSYSINGKVSNEAFSGRWETYYRPPLRRIDLSVGTGTRHEAFTLYVTETGPVVCSLPYAPPCERITQIELEQTSLWIAGLDQPFRGDLGDYALARSTEERIGGQDVSCFVLERGTGKLDPNSVELQGCYTADGIVMRLGVRAANVELEMNGLFLYREVAEADVTLPAGALP